MFTFPTTLGDLLTSLYAMLGDCADHRARLRFQPRSRTCRPVSTLCSGLALITLQPQLGDCSSQLHMNWTHIQLRGDFNFLDLAIRLILSLLVSSGTTSVRCTWRCIWVSEFLYRFFFLDPGTTCLHHLLPDSGTKWTHLFFWKPILLRKVKWAYFIKKEIFFLKSTMHYLDNLLLRCQWWSIVFRTTIATIRATYPCWSEMSILIGQRSSRWRVASQYMELGD